MDFYKEIKEYSQQNLRACQLKQLAILEEIDKICKRHKIEYWLCLLYTSDAADD